jgi:hypothetical protein
MSSQSDSEDRAFCKILYLPWDKTTIKIKGSVYPKFGSKERKSNFLKKILLRT